MKTKYIEYLGVSITIATNGTAFADYPNEPEIVEQIAWRIPDTTRELLSDSKRYRVYYPKNSLGRLFTDIEWVMK